jgi:hypothetical protein
MHAGHKKEPFHVGQQASRKHVQAISSARPALVTQFFGRRGSSEDAAALGVLPVLHAEQSIISDDLLLSMSCPCPVQSSCFGSKTRHSALLATSTTYGSEAGCCTTHSL